MKIFLKIMMVGVFGFFSGWGIDVHAKEDKEFLKDLTDVRDPFLSQLPPPKDPAPSPPANNAPPVQAEAPPNPVIVPVPLSTEKFVPPLVEVQQPAALNKEMKVMGLIWNSDKPQAIVNDTVLSVGDLLDGMKVTSIRRKKIEFLNNGMKVVVDVPE